MEILPFCSPNSPFYAEPTAYRPDRDLDVPLPVDWLVDEGTHWRSLFPIGLPPRTHGWKIHLSSTIQGYPSVLGAAVRICVDSRTPFKYVSRWDEVRGALSKNAQRSSAGKLVVIYPPDDRLLNHIAEGLDAALNGFSSPYVLGDVRFRSGPVYFRYGGFMPLVIPDADGGILAHPDESSTLVPDVRSPVFRQPVGRHPPVVEEAVSALAVADGLGPLNRYASIEPIQFSNAGGVYLATSHDGLKSILKEARPHAGLDASGLLAPSRLRQEHTNLLRLQNSGIVPGVLDFFQVSGHDFLEMQYVEGVSLLERTSRLCPGLDPTGSADARISYAVETLHLLRQLVDCVEHLHSMGVVFGDLHPGNVIVTSGNDVVLIDLEDGRAPGSRTLGLFNAIGYAPPAGFTAAESDWFSLSRVAMSAFEPAFAREILSPDVWPQLIERVADLYGPDVEAFISELESRFRDHSAVRLLRPESPPNLAQIDATTTDRTIARVMARSLASLSREHCLGDPLDTSTLRRFSYVNGTAGLATALHRSQVGVPADMVSGLTTAYLTSGAELGLFDGLAGIAATLSELGQHEAADLTCKTVQRAAGRVRSVGLARGLAGIAVQQIDYDLDFAVYTAHRATRRSHTDLAQDSLGRAPGLWRGSAGLAFAQALVGKAAEDAYLMDSALESLAMDRRRRRDSRPGVAGLGECDGRRTFPYLENGSAGYLIAYSALRLHDLIDGSSAYEDDVEAFMTACTSDLYAFDGLLRGRAGILAGLQSVSPWFDVATSMREQASHLRRSLVSWNGGTFSVGDQLLRLSTDVGTGSAGVLLMLLSLDEGTPLWLPGLINSRVRPRYEGR